MILEVGINITKGRWPGMPSGRPWPQQSLIEASLDPLVTIGPDGKITDVNMATESITGRSRAELITDFSDYFTEPEIARAATKRSSEKASSATMPLRSGTRTVA